MKGDYYSSILSARRLKNCYDIAPPCIQRYLQAEMKFVATHIHPGFTVLELGCGYGRVLSELASLSRLTIGIDISLETLELAQVELSHLGHINLVQTDASVPSFKNRQFDLIFCIQNGISAFHIDKKQLIESTVQLLRPGGTALFSSYAQQFWEHRLEWFRLQADAGLIGPIDENATGNGIIVCTDGFEAHTVGPDEFKHLTRDLDAETELRTIDASSLFCRIRTPPMFHPQNSD